MRMSGAWAKIAAAAVTAWVCVETARGETELIWMKTRVGGLLYDAVVNGVGEFVDPVQEGVVAVVGCDNNVPVVNIPSYVNLSVVWRNDDEDEWEETRNFRVTEIQPVAFAGNTALESVTIPASVKLWWGLSPRHTLYRGQVFSGCTSLTEVNLPADMKSIEPSMFSGCTALPSVTIPASVETLEDNAFTGCTSLGEMQLPGGLKSIGDRAFAGCTALPSMTIPASVETLGTGAFSGCTSLADLSLAGGLTSIGAKAFENCTALESVTIPASVETWGKNVFSGCTALGDVTLSAGLKTVGATVFSGCSGLTNIVFGEGVASVETNAFEGCYRLPKLVLPASMKTLEAEAFSACTALAEVDFGGTEEIGDKAFEGCTGLKAVSFPAGTRRIGAGAFSGCTGLATVALPGGVEEVEAGAFSGASVKSLFFDNSRGEILDAFSKESLRTLYLGAEARGVSGARLGDCMALAAVLVAKGNAEYAVDSAGVLYDKGMTRLIRYPAASAATNYTVPATVRSVDAKAFAYATALREVTFQGGVTEIGEGAFDWCIALEKVSFPAGLQTVGAGAFKTCPSLETLRFEGVGNDVPVFGEGQFLYAKPTVQIHESEYWLWTWTLDKMGLAHEWIEDEEGGAATTGTPVAVPHAWLESKAARILAENGGDYEAAAGAVASNGVDKVWQCYVAGLEPEDPESHFVASIGKTNGAVRVSWNPDLGAERRYVVKGSETLESWGETNEASRFFRVNVGMAAP